MTEPLFFSGGTALREVSRLMAARGIASTHLVTIHDSGGSSRELRRKFHMPAIGDIRNRLLALAPAAMFPARDLLAFRIPAQLPGAKAAAVFRRVLDSGSWRSLPAEAGHAIMTDLLGFYEAAGDDFAFPGASLGNLALAGAWLRSGGDLDYAVERYSSLLQVIGRVAPAAAGAAHLAVRLRDGRVFWGQHTFKDIASPVVLMWFTNAEPWGGGKPFPALMAAHPQAAGLIAGAGLICYSMGSFYSSLLASLLPAGVGSALALSNAKKVYIPNLGHDPEQCGLDVVDQARIILAILRADVPGASNDKLLNAILVDSGPAGQSCLTADRRRCLDHMGIELVEAPVAGCPGRHDPQALLEALTGIGER